MLEMLAERLINGPFETDVLIHGPTVQQIQRMKIHLADQTGIVAQKRTGGMFSESGWGAIVAIPWSAITMITLGAAPA